MPDTPAREGELLLGGDGKHYLIESGRLRRVVDPTAIGLDEAHARTLDLLNLNSVLCLSCCRNSVIDFVVAEASSPFAKITIPSPKTGSDPLVNLKPGHPLSSISTST